MNIISIVLILTVSLFETGSCWTFIKNSGESNVINPKDTHYYVTLQCNEQKNLTCSGSLITLQHVLTSARCIYSLRGCDIVARAGILSRFLRGDSIPAKELYPHKSFNETNPGNDIGVIKLESPFPFSDKIKPIKLAMDAPEYSSKTVVVGVIGDLLKTFEISLLTNEKCVEELKREHYEEIERLELSKSDVCGQSQNANRVCNIEAGSPLVSEKGPEALLIGIASKAMSKCAEKDGLNIYTSVFHHLSDIKNWIKE